MTNKKIAVDHNFLRNSGATDDGYAPEVLEQLRELERVEERVAQDLLDEEVWDQEV